MDVAELRAIYTATSTDFDRVTDHVQRRLKETQGVAAGLGGATQTVANEVRKIESTLTSRAPVKFLGIDVASEKRAASEVVNTARTTVEQVQQATTKFDPATFWARQGQAATNAAKVVETETRRAAASTTTAWANATTIEERLHSRRAGAATKATATVIRDAKTGATLTQAELAKLISGGSKVVEAEAKKVGHATGTILGDLRRLFLQNNFLFRQIGQRVAGDLGFIAVGTGKLAINFQQLATQSGAAAAGLTSVVSSAGGVAGALGPVAVGIGAVVVGITAVTAASLAAAAGLFFVSKSVSDNLEHFDDLSRQTGLSSENLQALDIITRQAGTNLNKLTNSVGQLQRKLIDASEGGTSRFSVGLKKLGIDLEDPNRALSQLFDLLIKLPAGTTRTGAAIQIFGRGGRDVAGVVDQLAENVGKADGALERLKKQLIDSGIHIDRDGTQNAAKFHDQWIKIEAQFESVKRVVGEEALPTVLDAATRFSDWVARNRVEIGDWAKAIVHATEKVVELGVALLKLTGLSIAIPVVINAGFSGPAAEILQGIGKVFSGGPQLQPLKFEKGAPVPPPPAEPVEGRRFRFGDKPFDFAQGRALTTPKQESAEDVAKRIRDAFAPTKRGGGGGRGEDPAQTARRLAEIALQETLKGLQAEYDALQRHLDLNLASRTQFTQDAINLELRRREETIKGLKVELEAAERIRKPGQRAIRVAEINARIKEEERRSAKEVQQITDDAAAEQLRVGQATAQSQLRIVETQTERVKARIRDLASFRMITEQQAAEFEQNQTLRVFNARERILRQELIDAGKNAEKRAEAQNKLNELDEERKSFIEESSRRIAAAIRNDAIHVIQFAAQIRDAFQQAAATRLEAREADLEPLRNSLLTRHQLWDAELRFEIEREKQRHDAVVAGLKDEAETARIRILNAKELAATLDGIRARETAAEEFHQARLRQITTQAAEQRRQEMLQVADDLASIASEIFDAIGKSSEEFWQSLRQSAANFARQLRDELFKGFLEKLITGQAQGAEGLIGAIINPLLGATGPSAAVVDNTKATEENTKALNSLITAMGGTPALPTTAAGLSGVLQFLPSLFGGGRASGGSVEAGKIYQIHDDEFFRPNISGKIYNLDQMSQVLNRASGETRTIVALGDDAVSEAMESHRLTPQGRRAQIVRGRWNRKTGGLQFA